LRNTSQSKFDMKNLLALLFLITFSFSAAGNTPKISLEKYIETWKDVAISQMHSHGVPASITLAQGILESGFGNSDLAVKANNHFGIKCHDWKGESFLKDDDKRNECFRKYKNAAQSFEDHSHFLTGRSRYAFLFDLDVTDYKGWAKGLKQAGYATNPSYDKRLIDLIERYDLDQYDKYSFDDLIVNQEPELQNKKDTQAPKLNAPSKNTHTQAVKNKRQVHTNKNRTMYVIAGNHDTFYQISKEFGVSLRQLNRWNDFPADKEVLEKGDKVYIMRKRKRIAAELTNLKVTDLQELWKISQEHGVQLKSLAERNNITPPNFALNK